MLAELGIKCVEDPALCTYLAAPHLVRTEKFCCALARAPTVVSTTWVEACVREARLIDPKEHLLRDPEGEKRLRINLSVSLARARANQGLLLDDQAVYCAPGVHGGFETCRRIVEANGGVCVPFRTAKRPANAPDSERIVLLSGDGPGDRKLWGRFQGMAEALGREWCVYRAEWLLEMALGQRLEWSDKYNVE